MDNTAHINIGKDFGVIINNHLQMSSQFKSVTRRASVILKYRKGKIPSNSRGVILPPYMLTIKPLLKYSGQFWCLYLKKDL